MISINVYITYTHCLLDSWWPGDGFQSQVFEFVFKSTYQMSKNVVGALFAVMQLTNEHHQVVRQSALGWRIQMKEFKHVSVETWSLSVYHQGKLWSLCCLFWVFVRLTCPHRLQEPDLSGCPLSMRNAGSWWRPAGTGTPPRGPCSVLWSPACSASWSGCANVAQNRKAAASRTQTEITPDKLTRVCDKDSDQWSISYLWRTENNRRPMKYGRAVVLVHSCWT